MGSSRITLPVSHSRFKCEYGSKEMRRTLSSTPMRRSTFIEFGIIWIPAPTRSNWGACS